MALTEDQRSLKRWGEQNWRTASGKPSTQGPDATGEVYQPAAKIKRMKSTPAGRRKLARANEAKRRTAAKGKQYAKTGLNKK